jgi:adenine-specific DNA-methyltransferase
VQAPYLEKQLIAYIGNKRRLLPLIGAALRRCPGTGEMGQAPLFVDFFAGSGSVARLAKLLGFRVIANDWEQYSALLNRAFLTHGRSELAGMYPERGGIEKVLTLLNTLPPPAPTERYISEYYCPRDTATADPDRERLYYTRENGERIDAIRAWIEREYPGEQEEPRRRKEKELLLGLLLYEAATHANTSGVFKAYHRGFGGRAGDALGRIMGPVALEYPELIDGEAEVASLDAAVLARQLAAAGRRALVAYLDPPYNQHQYGSNYHLLNTIAKNDRPALSREIVRNGKKVETGGIRRDWGTTRSEYCYRKSATASFAALVAAIDARFLLVSYSTEGIIPFREMLDMLGSGGGWTSRWRSTPATGAASRPSVPRSTMRSLF